MRLRSMKTAARRMGHFGRLAIGAGGLLVTSFSVSCNTEQPAPFCTISRATYAARYELVSGGPGACADLKGEVLGGQAYLADSAKPGDKGSVALQSEALGQRLLDGAVGTPVTVDPDESHKVYAYGKFTADTPNSDHVCTAPTLADARWVQGAFTGPAGEGGVAGTAYPATDVTYHWSNVKSFVTAASTGVVIGGDLELTVDGCKATYKMVGIAPKISCADENGQADQSICDKDPNLNPDTAIVCEPTTMLCVPSKDFPSLRSGK